jgi:hypothetical protein
MLVITYVKTAYNEALCYKTGNAGGKVCLGPIALGQAVEEWAQRPPSL